MVSIIALLSIAHAGTQRVDFDALAVTANVAKPSIVWLRDVSARLCADASDRAKVECQVNTDYGAIVKLCQSLRVADTDQVSRIMAEAKSIDFYALGTSEWSGCIYNAKTGWNTFFTNFSHVDEELVMYDDPGPWFKCTGSADQCGADSAFDSRDWSGEGRQSDENVRAYHSSYLLSAYRSGGKYKTVPSYIMRQLESTKAPWYDFDGTRPNLPRFDLPNIVFLSGTLAVFQGGFSYGILFQSLTGHDYAEATK